MVLQDVLESSQAVLFRFPGTCPETRKVLKSGNSEKCHTSRVSGAYSTQVKWEIKPLNAFNTGNMIPISWKKTQPPHNNHQPLILFSVPQSLIFHLQTWPPSNFPYCLGNVSTICHLFVLFFCREAWTGVFLLFVWLLRDFYFIFYIQATIHFLGENEVLGFMIVCSSLEKLFT